jgi:hypothetical protein
MAIRGMYCGNTKQQALLRGDVKNSCSKKNTYLHYEKSASGIDALADIKANIINDWLTSKGLLGKNATLQKANAQDKKAS